MSQGCHTSRLDPIEILNSADFKTKLSGLGVEGKESCPVVVLWAV